MQTSCIENVIIDRNVCKNSSIILSDRLVLHVVAKTIKLKESLAKFTGLRLKAHYAVMSLRLCFEADRFGSKSKNNAHV